MKKKLQDMEKIKLLLIALMLGVGAVANADYSFNEYKPGVGIMHCVCKDMLVDSQGYTCAGCDCYNMAGKKVDEFVECTPPDK